MIYILAKEKYVSEGRPFGTSDKPFKYSLVLLTNNSTIPSNFSDVEGLEECDFAPGSILLDTKQSKKYIYDGSNWVKWET